MNRQKQPAGNPNYQTIKLVRVARPENQRYNQQGPPPDLGKEIEMNFMAQGFAPDETTLRAHGGNMVEARLATFCKLVGKQGYMTPKDWKAKSFEKYGIDPIHIYDFEAETQIAEKDAEIEKLKAELAEAKKGGEK